MARIYLRKDCWYLDYAVGAKRIRRRVGPSKKVAELALKDIEVKQAKNEVGLLPVTDHLLGQFMDKYLTYSKTNHRAGTFKRYRAIIDNFSAFLADRKDFLKLSKLNASLFEDYKTYRRSAAVVTPNGRLPKEGEEGRRGAKAKTVNMELATLRAIFNKAVEWDYLRENPTKGVDMLREDHTKLPRYLSKEEVAALLAELGEEYRPYFVMLVYSGLRIGELLNLHWADIDWEHNRLAVSAKEGWVPKAGERVIPMHPKVREVLLARKQGIEKPAGVIFNHTPEPAMKKRLRRELMRASKVCGFPEVTKLHTMRHTFASQLVMSGVDLATVQQLLGHTDIEMTMIYAHLAPEHLKNAVDKLKF
jgi:integrase